MKSDLLSMMDSVPKRTLSKKKKKNQLSRLVFELGNVIAERSVGLWACLWGREEGKTIKVLLLGETRVEIQS